ncbi:E3 ubiquitin-protein ligase TRIM47-like [Amia ocellicauda]|uniref:E3 ubiquitin-protein ligase TRIM47-like n=1 Tax=Amia ocellicauda TaxID=2972642 RepID=UPI003464B8FF
MAQTDVLLDQDQFSCPICLDLLKDLVTIPCGPSYCLGCIKNCWDQDDHTAIYSCPQCRQTFTPRPVLGRNIMLAEVVEKLKKSQLNAPLPAQCPAGPGDLPCDFCTEGKLRAVKHCLVCLASYCQTHLQPHYEFAPLKRHKLVNATGHLDDVLCSNNQKLLEIYCRTDQKCICYLCMVDDHKGHNTVSATAERTEKQTHTQQRCQQRAKELKTLRQPVEALKSSAQTAVEDSERIFTELINSIERRCCEVTQMIRAQETAAVSHAEGLLERLEQEIAEMWRRDTDLNQRLS